MDTWYDNYQPFRSIIHDKRKLLVYHGYFDKEFIQFLTEKNRLDRYKLSLQFIPYNRLA